MTRVSHKVERRRFRRRNEQRAPRRVESLNRHIRETLARHEGDAHCSALDRPAVPRDEDLELLRAMTARTVILCGGQKARVVGEVETLHQRRDKLVGGKAAERAIFRREDDIEAARRRSDQVLFCQAVQRELGGSGGNAQRRLRLAGGKVIPAAGGQATYISSGAWTANSEFTTAKHHFLILYASALFK
jgi:hypothetical protein